MSNTRKIEPAGVCLSCLRLQRENEQLAGALQHAVELGDALHLAYEELLADTVADLGQQEEPVP